MSFANDSRKDTFCTVGRLTKSGGSLTGKVLEARELRWMLTAKMPDVVIGLQEKGLARTYRSSHESWAVQG
jgi:hypothetical protein